MKKFEMKKNEKGFTLVELIVVLVILAILATLLVPALTGYIDKAKEKTVVAECRSCVTAAQTLLSEQYAIVGSTADVNTDAYKTQIKTLAEVPGTIGEITCTSGMVTGLVYTATDGKVCTYAKDANGVSTYTVS